MKKTILLALLLIGSLASVKAQVASSDSVAKDTVKTVSTTTPDQEKEKKIYDMPRLMGGIRLGMAWSDMRYSHSPVSRYDHFWRTSPVAGLYLQFPIGSTPLSLRPEITFISRGDSLSWLDVNYGITAHYLDLRLPITWNFRFGDNLYSPYLMVAPQLNLPYNGVIGYSADDFPSRVTTPLTDADMRKADISLMLGAGVDFTINTDLLPIYVAVEGGYNFGLVNNFSKREIIDNSSSPATILNNFFGSELWHKSRHNRGIELAVRISVPLDRDFLRRYRDRRKVLPDTVILVNTQFDTIIEKGDTVIIERTIEIPVKQEYHTKECFTIAELNELMEQGNDIRGKRICMFDIKFDFDSYKIRSDSEAPLNELVKMMTDYPQMTIEVYGHTDSIGTPQYNQKLSENRAKAVVEYLNKSGISPSRIKSFGYGLNYPIDTNSTEEGRFRNRRVEFEVITIGLKRKYEQ